jgi:hypothetical protein
MKIKEPMKYFKQIHPIYSNGRVPYDTQDV